MRGGDLHKQLNIDDFDIHQESDTIQYHLNVNGLSTQMTTALLLQCFYAHNSVWYPRMKNDTSTTYGTNCDYFKARWTYWCSFEAST